MYSFQEENDSIISMDTYDTITLAQYFAYHEKDASRAIPTLCILTIKPNEMMNLHCTKSRIAILGSHKDRCWLKPDTYPPVLRPDTMRLLVGMAIEQQCTLQQGNCKNAFCQGLLPPGEITILKPSIGDPDAKR